MLAVRATVARDDTEAISAAGHDQFGAGADLDRRRRPARIAQLLVAAGRALRARRNVMLHDGRAQQIVADDVIVQFGAKAGGDRLGDFERRKLDRALSERLAGQRRDGDGARRRRGREIP